MHKCGLCSPLPWRHGHSFSDISLPALTPLTMSRECAAQESRTGRALRPGWQWNQADRGANPAHLRLKLYRVPITLPPQSAWKEKKRKECTSPCEVRRCGWNNPHTMLFIKGTLWIPHRDWLNPQYGVLCGYKALTQNHLQDTVCRKKMLYRLLLFVFKLEKQK